MVEIIPAILTDSSEKFKELVHKLESYTGRIHIDIADGIFVPNKTITGYDEIKQIESALKFDVHLMVEKPEEHLKEWIRTHADRFIIHAESKSDLTVLVDELHKNGRKVGLAFNPETDSGKFKDLINKIDFVQFMTVHPGFQGGQFVESVLERAREFKNEYPNISIAVDGSMHLETAKLAVAAGASIIVVGGHILLENRNVGEAIEELNKSCTI